MTSVGTHRCSILSAYNSMTSETISSRTCKDTIYFTAIQVPLEKVSSRTIADGHFYNDRSHYPEGTSALDSKDAAAPLLGHSNVVFLPIFSNEH